MQNCTAWLEIQDGALKDDREMVLLTTCCDDDILQGWAVFCPARNAHLFFQMAERALLHCTFDRESHHIRF